MRHQNKSESERVAQLARMSRFSDFTDDEIRKVVEHGTLLTVPEGWALIAESTPADKAYLILEGEVSVRRGGEEVARVGAGDVIGEMALVDRRLRSATVVAVSTLEVLHFTSETVAELQKSVPHFRDALSAAAAERHGNA